jgi:methionine-rich copper-binding protein CopC
VEVSYSLDPGVTGLDVDYLQEGEAVASARFKQRDTNIAVVRHTVRLQPGEYEVRFIVYGPDGRGVEHAKALLVPAEGLTRFDLKEATTRSQ